MTRVVAARFTYDFPYASRRAPVFARRAIATSHPLASQAGLAVLASGGNAVEAAIAAAATLTVVEPTMNGLGSDLFAMVWDADFGGAQAVARITGGYCAASDHRKDGQAAGI